MSKEYDEIQDSMTHEELRKEEDEFNTFCGLHEHWWYMVCDICNRDLLTHCLFRCFAPFSGSKFECVQVLEVVEVEDGGKKL
jgi:hypothetical protein